MNSLLRRVRESVEESINLSRPATILVLLLIVAGLATRIGFLVLHGNRTIGSFSGVGDQERYIALADSVFQGRGLSYFNHPTALRPPVYPLLLAGSHVIFGHSYPFVVRFLQFLIGIVVAYICLLIAQDLFGKKPLVGLSATAIALALPSLILISAELQTEQLATLLTTLFLMFLIAEIERNESYSVRLGICSGLATLLRFNCAILVVIGAAICLWSKRSLKEASVLCFVAALIVAPWIVRNAVVFQGKILFSSHGGINLLEGVLTPDGRAQSGESERIRAEVGWLHSDIEVNDPHRNLFSSEPQLDRQADLAAIAAWKNLGWKSAVTLSLKKTLRFWFSTDQMIETNSFSTLNRRLRAVGVLVYWIVLAFAITGWCYLYSSSRTVALTLGFYVLFFTLAHLPFVMNTRLRIPFADPLIAILAGRGFVASVERIRQSFTREPDLKPNRERDLTSQMHEPTHIRSKTAAIGRREATNRRGDLGSRGVGRTMVAI